MHTRKRTVGGVIGTIVLAVLIIALLIFTATRTVHFLQMTFPPDMGYVAYLALAAFDGGILGWTFFASTAAQGVMQRGLAYIMIFVCALGVILTTIADTMIMSAANGMTHAPAYMAAIGIWGSLAVIVLNVVAGICVHLVSPDHSRKFEMENIHDKIWASTIQAIRTEATLVTPQLAQETARAWTRETMQDVYNSLPHSELRKQIGAPKVVDADRSKLIYASRDHAVDPHGVRKTVSSQKKSIENQGSFIDKLKDAFDFRAPETEELIEDEDLELAGDVEIVEEIEETPVRTHHDWTSAEWRKAKDDLDAFEYAEKYKDAFGEEPPMKTIEKKKGAGGRKPKNVAESQGE